MLPASRTPEGDFFLCPICRAESLVLGSDPPGDSVCPNCGAYGWMQVTAEVDYDYLVEHHARQSSARRKRRWKLEELELQVQQAKSLDEVGDHLVKFLAGSLEAYGANVWIQFETGWWLKKKSFSLLATAGMCHTSKFAREVFQAQRTLMLPSVIQGHEVVYLGVPFRGVERVMGSVEVIQRGDESFSIHEAYLSAVLAAARVAQDCKVVRECEFGWEKMLTLPMSAARLS